MTQMTTVAVDRYGRVYDLRSEHPSWEAAKEAKRRGSEERCIVVNAFAVDVRELPRLRKTKGRVRFEGLGPPSHTVLEGR